MALYVFDWIMFVVILISVIKNKHNSQKLKSNESSTKLHKENLIIALSLAVVFGLGWGFGLLTTSSSIEGLTTTFQVIFSIFVGAQGALLFLLHGVRNPDVRAVWKGWWTSLGNITRLSSVSSSSSKTTLPQSMNTTGAATLLHILPHHEEGVVKTDQSSLEKHSTISREEEA